METKKEFLEAVMRMARLKDLREADAAVDGGAKLNGEVNYG